MSMMTNLRDLISKVLEEMFFMIEETPPDDSVENYSYESTIDDPFFTIKVLLGEELALEITSNFLGMEDEIEEEDIYDCLKEIVNMFAGNFIGDYYPQHDKLIPIPETLKLNSYKEEDYKDFESTVFYYDSKPLKLLLKEK